VADICFAYGYIWYAYACLVDYNFTYTFAFLKGLIPFFSVFFLLFFQATITPQPLTEEKSSYHSPNHNLEHI
jgi:hypothetical protein